eukprot:scaffold133365_cov31-Prasinocladus_malaysianus.AAC.2
MNRVILPSKLLQTKARQTIHLMHHQYPEVYSTIPDIYDQNDRRRAEECNKEVAVNIRHISKFNL